MASRPECRALLLRSSMMSTAVAATVVALGRAYDRPTPLEHQET